MWNCRPDLTVKHRRIIFDITLAYHVHSLSSSKFNIDEEITYPRLMYTSFYLTLSMEASNPWFVVPWLREAHLRLWCSIWSFLWQLPAHKLAPSLAAFVRRYLFLALLCCVGIGTNSSEERKASYRADFGAFLHISAKVLLPVGTDEARSPSTLRAFSLLRRAPMSLFIVVFNSSSLIKNIGLIIFQQLEDSILGRHAELNIVSCIK